jgi:hypothetical protein
VFLVLDWAAKFSAGMVMDRSGSVQHQFDSWRKPNLEFCEEVASIAADYEVSWVVVEDVPHGIKSLRQTKPVVRTQGVLADELSRVDKLEVTRFLQPAIWQRHFGLFRQGWKAARIKANELGYQTPDLISLYGEDIPNIPPKDLDPALRAPLMKERGSVMSDLRKAMTDYDDSFLIGRWTLEQTEDSLLDATQEYFPL